MSTLIKHGTIVTAGDTYPADILIEGEKIVQIGSNLQANGAQVVNAEKMLVMPGGIDVHTHLELPFGGTVASDDYVTGHRAAAFGGTTSHIDFVIQPAGGSLHAGLDTWRKKADGKASIDYGFHLAVTDLNDKVMNEIPSLVGEGITSIKLFMAYKGVLQVDDTTLFKGMLKAAEAGMLTMVHAENGDVIDVLVKGALAKGEVDPKYHGLTRPEWCEAEATGRAIMLAGIAGAPLYVVHMTCEGSLDMLRYGRDKGFKVMGETCVQYLFFTQDNLAAPGYEGAKYVCSPPMRQPKDQQALWRALSSGLLQVVSTDHCPFYYDGAKPGAIRGKELGEGDFSKIPNGVPGIEDRQMIMWDKGVNGGHFNANRFVELTATNPAKIFGMYPRKGTIAVNGDADIVLWDAHAKHTISAATMHMRTDYNLYEGWQVSGKPVKVFLRGKLIVDGDKWQGEQGKGQFVRRSPHAQVL
ncbi:MAG TPA: dihydropyrimidinase [Candidatus Eremiobacteraceae bacterium]|nr:dihydropyrimidinase [Candidatus Eremiobacteraceae bacterium]